MVGGGEAGQELELHVAEAALGAEVPFDVVLEQAGGFHQREVGRQLLRIERLDAVRAGVGMGAGHPLTVQLRIQSTVPILT